MNTGKLLGLLIGSAVILGLHWNGMYHGGYLYFWYDSMMHFLGGAWIAAALHELLYGMYRFGNLSRAFAPYMLAVVGGTFVVGIGWEVFEYVYGIATLHPEMYWPDTVKDLALDTLGAIAVVLAYLKNKA
jgi:hypothetical protein